jgi:Protein of unknown function (DUF664)
MTGFAAEDGCMYTPASDDEITGLVSYIDQQLDAIRASAIGLTEEQARMRPCRSALSIGGLIKHTTYVMVGATRRLTSGDGPPPVIDEAAFTAHESSLALADDETTGDAIVAFDAARGPYLATVARTDPGAPTLVPPAPWYGIHDARPANRRFDLVHQIEEMARHAGHADIIREQIDGIAVPAIVLSEDGAQANEFFQPYVAQTGTIGAT